MATKQNQNSASRISVKVSRKGVHAKTKTSKNKTSKKYKKQYVGQGR